MQDELHIVMSEMPLYKIISYRKLFCRGSINDTVKVSNACCEPLSEVRKIVGGRFRLDQIVLDTVRYGSEDLQMLFVDLMDELGEERELDNIRTHAPGLHSGVRYREDSERED